MNFNFIRASSLVFISLFLLTNSGFAAKQTNTTTKAVTSENHSGEHVVKTQGLPEGGIKSARPDTTTAPKKSASAPNLSDFNVKLKLSQGNAIKITNVDLFSVVSDNDVGDIYSIYSISNLKPSNAGCATILDGEIIFIASKGFVGDAVIDYTVIDGEGTVSDTEQVTVHVVKE